MKRTLTFLLVLLSLGFGVVASAQEVPAPDATTMATITIMELIEISELMDGPVILEESKDQSELLTTVYSMIFGKNPGIPASLEIAVEKGQGEHDLGDLVHLDVSTVSKVPIDALRYSIERSEDGSAIDALIVLDCTVDGETQYLADTITLKRNNSSLLVEKPADNAVLLKK